MVALEKIPTLYFLTRNVIYWYKYSFDNSAQKRSKHSILREFKRISWYATFLESPTWDQNVKVSKYQKLTLETHQSSAALFANCICLARTRESNLWLELGWHTDEESRLVADHAEFCWGTPLAGLLTSCVVWMCRHFNIKKIN